MDELFKRMDTAEKQIKRIKDATTRWDLETMLGAAARTRQDLSMEAVTCRRLHKPTPDFIAHYEKLEKQIYDIEKNITYAVLTSSYN